MSDAKNKLHVMLLSFISYYDRFSFVLQSHLDVKDDVRRQLEQLETLHVRTLVRLVLFFVRPVELVQDLEDWDLFQQSNINTLALVLCS